ncbi:DUF4397 domain-containing protein [Bacillus sonorensis]|uniref:DUF4397 domain-containing protein n=1 Tax=Bacillus sonorensis TaxID=119858 RepID=UPI00227E484E|nr:DUF4397 domain-containing protein [Bacillus sonorensis]MCY8024439.1 DUF4397 domain-containing protein [Bacillus sonorensis]
MGCTIHAGRRMWAGPPGKRQNLTALPAFRSGGRQALLRVLHAAPDIGNIDVLVNGLPLFRNAAYRELSAFAPVASGLSRIDILKANGNHSPLLTVQYHLMPAGHYTAGMTGTLSKPLPIVMSDRMPVPPGERSMRFVHLSPDAPALDLAIKKGPVLFANIPFANASHYISCPFEKNELEIRAAGTETVLLNIPKVDFQYGQSVTFYCTGYMNGTPSLEILKAP